MRESNSQAWTVPTLIHLNLFFNHAQCVTATGYLAGKAGPLAPDRGYSILTSCLTGGAILHWPNACQFDNT